jgi:membrane protein EpsK
MGLVNLPLMLLLPAISGWGVMGVAAAGAIVLTLKNALFAPWYAARIFQVKAGIFSRALLPGLAAFVLVAAAAWGVTFWARIGSWPALCASSLTIALLFGAAAWKFGLTGTEQGFCLEALVQARQGNGAR